MIEIDFTQEFKRNLRQLSKRYRSIRSDIEPLIENLKRGETPGDQIKGTRFTIFKVRLRNTDISKGKSAGYRVIYYVKTPIRITLLTLYSKSDQGDISNTALIKILKDYQA